MDEKSISFCKYLLEYSIFSGTARNYLPATMVMSAISLAESVFKTKFDVKLQNTAKIPKEATISCFKEMCGLMENAKSSDLKAIRRKYMKGKHHGVSKLTFSL